MLVFEEPWTHPNSQGTSWINTNPPGGCCDVYGCFPISRFHNKNLKLSPSPRRYFPPPLEKYKVFFLRPSTDHQGYETARSSYGEVGRLPMNGFSGRVMPGSVGAHPTWRGQYGYGWVVHQGETLTNTREMKGNNNLISLVNIFSLVISCKFQGQTHVISCKINHW